MSGVGQIMRNTIIGLLISLLVLLVYIASCGPNQAEKSGQQATVKQTNVDAATAPAEGVAPAEQQALATSTVKPVVEADPPAAENKVQRAEAALRAAGFHGVSVQEVDGSLLMRGNVDSPSDRVRAGRSLAQLGMPVINHVRAKQANTAKPLALVIEKRNGTVSLRGDMTPAMHQSLKQRYSLAGSSAVKETTISTPNASGVVQLAASAIDRLNSGSVRITDTRVVVNGESTGDAQAFRMGLNRGLPRGFSLTTNVRTAAAAPSQLNSAGSSAPLANTVPVAVAETVPVRSVPATPTYDSDSGRRFNQPATVQAVSSERYQTTTVSSVQDDYPLAKTYPLEPGDLAYRPVNSSSGSVTSYAVTETQPNEYASPRYRSVTSYDDPASQYPIAETIPLEVTSEAYPSVSRYSDSAYSEPYSSEVYVEPTNTTIAYAEPVTEPAMRRSGYSSAVANTGSINAGCYDADLNLMPNGSIRFFHNSAQLTHKSRQRMELALSALRRCPQLNIEVAGHTDVTGADDTNGDISRARAERIALYLRENGISADRLRVASYGDSQPAFPNDSKFGRAMNRRVELVIQR